MKIIVGSEASIPTPSSGYKTLFVNTDQDNLLYYKNDDGTATLYTGDNVSEPLEVANTWTKAVSCAFSKGFISTAQFQAIMAQGFMVITTEVTNSDGSVTKTTSVGSRDILLTSITLDSSTQAKPVAATHQIVTTFDPVNTSNQGLIYITSNATLATVSATGLVSCLSVGVVVITVIPVADPSKSKTVTITIS